MAAPFNRGQVLPFFAICLAVLMGFAGLAVDLGYVQYQQRQQQSATDAAAIAGAQALIANNTCPDNAAALTAAENDAKANGFSNGGNIAVTAEKPGSGPFSNDNCAVQATITSPHPSWFSQLFGFTGDISTTAIAAIESSAEGAGCLYLLDGNLSANGISINSPNCGVVINGSISTNGGTYDTDYLGYSGSLSENGSSFTKASPTKMLPAANPCPDITGCNSLTNDPPATPAPTSGCTSLSLNAPNDYQIPAGCYNSITLNGGSVAFEAGTIDVGSLSANGTTISMQPGDYGAISGNGITINMAPGLYVLNGTNSANGTVFNGTGVTIYQLSGGFAGNGTDSTLSACTSSCTDGAVSGVLFFQPTSNTSSVAINGTGASYSGLVYAPSASVAANGAGTGYVIYVAESMSINGSTFTDTPPSPIPNAGPTPAGLYIKQSILAY